MKSIKRHKHIWNTERMDWHDVWYCEVEGCEAKPRKDIGDRI